VTPLLPAAFDDVQQKRAPRPYALIRVESDWTKLVCAVSREQLGRGVLVGRYGRCGIELGGADLGISRVHLLLFRVEERIIAVDTASTNGIWLEGRRVPSAVLESGVRLRIGIRSSIGVSWPVGPGGRRGPT
jgi:hypothetical protein